MDIQGYLHQSHTNIAGCNVRVRCFHNLWTWQKSLAGHRTEAEFSSHKSATRP